MLFFVITTILFLLVLIATFVYSFIEGRRASKRKEEFLVTCSEDEKAIIERYKNAVNGKKQKVED